MGDVEEMIGELEEDKDPDDPPPKKRKRTSKDEDEEAWGLDIDTAWSSPDRNE